MYEFFCCVFVNFSSIDEDDDVDEVEVEVDDVEDTEEDELDDDDEDDVSESSEEVDDDNEEEPEAVRSKTFLRLFSKRFEFFLIFSKNHLNPQASVSYFYVIK